MKPPKAKLKITYVAVGTILQNIEKEQFVDCVTDRYHDKLGLDKIAYNAGWDIKNVYTTQASQTYLAVLSGNELAAFSVTHDLSFCQAPKEVNTCKAPNICEEIIDSCATSTFSSDTFYAEASVIPVKKGPTNKNWIVTLSQNEGLDAPTCAQGLLNSQALKAGVFTLRFKLRYNKKKKGGLAQLNNVYTTDCSNLPESSGYTNFKCELIVNVTGTAKIEGPFKVSPVK